MTKVFKYVLWTTLWFCPLVAHAQSTTIEDTDFPRYYRSPLEIPINLSGNFGEFRSNHFHAGYDMRIGGVVGAKLFAIAEGFVSRISVSPGGYGNGIYIEHPNGTTSVYGHLLDFASHIQEYVKEQQYERQSFSVDLPLSPDQFPVKKGDFIGRAGNSGASNGPHLHLEIRNTENQSLLYLSGYGLYPVPDRTPPQLTRLQFWGYSQQGAVPRTSLLRAVDLSARPSVIPVTDTFYVAMGAFDRIEGSPAYLSLAQYDVYIDDNKVYTYKKDNLPSSMGRYLNSYLQYDQRVNHDRTLLKTWLEPGNML
ncbi:MAG: M23 family metallopeptidase, partial [Bacteroidales bacterium]|nr:M23 family metallopeptidase [Bacteroidales bacterium]